MIIDFHIHYFPDNIAAKAIEKIKTPGVLAASIDGTKDALLSSMQEAGVDYSLNLPVATSAESERGVNRWASLNNKAPIFSLGSVHPETKNQKDIVLMIKDLGLKGIKMHPEYQQFSPDDPKLNGIWEACIDNDIFVHFHAGDDPCFPDPPNSSPDKFLSLKKRYPELNIILAHLGSWGMWDEVEAKLAGTTFYMDLSFIKDFVSKDQIISIIRKHGANRILFGTDSPWISQKKMLEFIQDLPLTVAEKEMIFYTNGAKLLGL